MQIKRLNLDKLKNSFKRLDGKKVISSILIIALVLSSLGLLGSLFGGSSSGGGSSGTSSGENNNSSVSTSPVSCYIITYHSNNGKDETQKQLVTHDINSNAYSNTLSNTFSSPSNDLYFIGWNTKADGSGKSYTEAERIKLTSDIALYAQWSEYLTISYYKIYGCEWPTVYPPAETGGPVNNADGNDYLIAKLDGKTLPGLADYFTVDEEGLDLTLPSSPVRTAKAKVGSKLYIELNNRFDGDLCAIYVNGNLVAGKSQSCNYTFTVPNSSNITITFKWVTTGVVGVNPQSFWVCNITYN